MIGFLIILHIADKNWGSYYSSHIRIYLQCICKVTTQIAAVIADEKMGESKCFGDFFIIKMNDQR